jgi:formate hydrogenlyase transcriptional activator
MDDLTDSTESVERRLEFETLISNISASLLAAPLHDVDSAVEAGVRGVREFFQADRGGILTVKADKGVVFLSHASFAEGIPPVSGDINLAELFPWAYRTLVADRLPLVVSRMADLPPEAAQDRGNWAAMGTRSCMHFPISVEDRVTHLIVVHSVREERTWPEFFLPRLLLLGQMLVNALERKQSHETLQRLRERLQQENTYLREASRQGSDRIVGRSPALRSALALSEQVAATDSSVLLLGETGTGKERFASFIHDSSRRRDRTMIRLNCSAIPTSLMESELFGREKGAFTGAMSRQIGRFELANGSTLFLDEIGDLPAEVQVKLLRALEEGTIERLGNPKPVPVDVRIIAATHRDLEQAVRSGTFREDLYYRLNVFPIKVPPLRERPDDIPILVGAFVTEFARSMGKHIHGVSPASMEALVAHSWPGNVRELRNVIERAMILATGSTLTVEVPAAVTRPPAAEPGDAIADLERRHITTVLARTGWRIRGKGGAAEALGLKPTTLEYRMTKLGIRRPGTT